MNLLQTIKQLTIPDITDNSSKLRNNLHSEFISIAENTDIIWLFTPELNITSVTPSIQQIIGYQPTEWLNEQIITLFTDSTLSTLKGIVDEYQNNGFLLQSKLYPLEFICKNKNIQQTETRISVLRNVGNMPVFHCISSLPTNNNFNLIPEYFPQISTFLNSVVDVVLLFDNQYRYLINYPKSPKFVYRPPEQIIGKTIDEVLPADTATLFKNAIDQTILTGAPTIIEYSLDLHGNLLWFDGRLSRLANDNVLFIGRDITPYKTTADRLLQTEAKLRSIIDASPQMLLLLDSNLKIEHFNKEAQINSHKYLGKPIEKGTSIYDYPINNDTLNTAITNALDGNSTVTEVAIMFYAKTTNWFEWHIAPVMGDDNHVINIIFSAFNISRLKTVEYRLRKSKGNLKAIFESSNQLYCLIGFDYRILSFNRVAAKFYNDLIACPINQGDSIYEVISSDYIVDFISSFENCKLGQIQKHERQYQMPDKSIVYHEVSFVPVYDENNQLFGVGYSAMDITRRKNYEYAVKLSEEKFLKAFEINPSLMAIIQVHDGIIIDANQCFLTTLGYSRDEALGFTFMQIELFSDSNTRNQTKEDVLKLGKVRDWELKFQTKQKESHIGLFSTEIITLDQTTCLLVVIVDITQRKSIEQQIRTQYNEIQKKNKEIEQANTYLSEYIEELRSTNEELSALNDQLDNANAALQQSSQTIQENEEKFRGIVEQSSDGVVLVNFDGQVIEWNQAMTTITGYQKHEIVHKHIWEIQQQLTRNYQTDYESNFIKLRNILHKKIVDQKQKYQTVNESTIYDSLDNLRYIYTSVYPIQTSKGIIFSAIIRDFTQRKLAEKKIFESEKRLRELNATKDKIFQIISHDLRGPLGTLHNLIEFMVEKPEDYDNETFETLMVMKQTASATYSLVENLLQWARIQKGNITVNPRNFNLNNLANDNVLLFSAAANDKQIILISSIVEQIYIYADYNMVDNVVRNLISNALKFTPKNGKITISAHIITQLEVPLVEVSVTDTGVGINNANLEKLFNESVVFTTPGTQGEGGTGLGFMICREFIAKNNGTLRVESEIGVGSSFIFRLPLGYQELINQ